jgi:hypothetical protein
MISLGKYKIVETSLRNFNGSTNDLIILEEDYGDKNSNRITIPVSSLPALTKLKSFEGLHFELQLIQVED